MSENEKPQAGAGWVLAGFLFGALGFLIALVTDKGDGRSNKALGGCMIWVIIVAVILLMAGM